MEKIDIVPALKKKIDDTFKDLVKNDEVLFDLKEKIEKNGSWKNAQDYASRIGQHRSTSFQESLDSNALPNGQLYYNIASRIIPPALESDYELVSEVGMEVQRQLNETSRIGIKAQKPDLNRDRIEGIVNRISSEPFEDVKWLLNAPIDNFLRSVVDETVEKNASFHYKSGLNPVIVRTASGTCCKWCAQRAGTYPYQPNMNREVFRRHENCKCTVAYYPDSNSKRSQNVWTKRWQQAPANPVSAAGSPTITMAHLQRLRGMLTDAQIADFYSALSKAPDSVQRAFSHLPDVPNIVRKKDGGVWKNRLGILEFDLDFDPRHSKFSTLCHEFNHYLDHNGTFSNLNFSEIDELEKATNGHLSRLFKHRASFSDEFLTALRKDREEVRKAINKDGLLITNPLFLALRSDDATAGVQDAIDGWFDTQDARILGWGHGGRYYNRYWSTVKKIKENSNVKKAYNNLGYKFKNQKQVAEEFRIYDTASEAWANVGSAVACGGPELEAVKKYLPNTYNAYEQIMKGIQ